MIGQDALERASQAIAALAEARRAIVDTHKELSIVQGQIGLGAITMNGDAGAKPPPQALETDRVRMRSLRSAS